MSIPLVQEATKDAINTSIIAIKRNIERINMLLGLVDSGSPDLSGLATKQELEDAITQVETDLAPVDEVTLDNMQSVTSNAVAETLSSLFNLNLSGLPKDANNASMLGRMSIYSGQENPNGLSNYPSISYSSSGGYPCYILIDFYPKVSTVRITQFLIVTYFSTSWQISKIYKRSKVDATWFSWSLLH